VSLPSPWVRFRRVVEHRLGRVSGPDTERPLQATMLVESGEEPQVRISRLGYGGGVGWYAQQSLDITLDEAKALVGLLTNASPPPEVEVATPTASVPVSLAAYRARRTTPRT
jgi:hypothetical protein